MEQRRATNLYYNCDETYTQGHICKSLFWLKVDDSEETPPLEKVEEPEMEEPAISLHAMIGLHSTNTMQVRSGLQHLQLLALVDSGNTHNFISQPAAQQLSLLIQQNTGISVSVANGEKISSARVYPAVPFDIEDHTFVTDIPLVGFDLVLGIKWLQQLGLILWDFKALTMSFMKDQHQLTLHGNHAPLPCTLQNIQLMASNHCKFNSLITEFADLFQEPAALPPIPTCDHQIGLKLGTKPVVLRPYRCPHFQKDEIEHQCQHMLAQGIIQLSRSLFLSLVLLVKKHDHS
ncbi:uncharacterized protein [Aristolochia californica]|uniref:uncharacterized protein n=1 Tax=Aristolochia californica TaxID=171875 RepID=UPI0035DF78D9